MSKSFAFAPSAAAAAATHACRRASSGIIGIRRSTAYYSLSSLRRETLLVGRNHDISVRRRCRRCFSQLTPRPLAHLHDHRDFDAIFFSHAPTTTIAVHSAGNNKTGSKKIGTAKDSRDLLNKGGRGSGIDGDDGSSGLGPGRDHKPPDERVVKLGKTLRKLSPRLPTILINALPTELLSPQITLHLFPSTHPHLPNVKGRVLYRAALWTVPVAWSSLPILGNVKLQILSERMVRADSVPGCEQHSSADLGEERLVVRWKTEPRGKESSNNGHVSSSSTTPSSSSSALPTSESSSNNSSISHSKEGVNKGLSTLLGSDTPIFAPGKEGQFEGLFVFAFDEQGRIAGHTIEHADRADGWDRTAKFVTLTDWLLGKARGSLIEQPVAGPALAAQVCHVYTNNNNYNYRLHQQHQQQQQYPFDQHRRHLYHLPDSSGGDVLRRTSNQQN